MKKFIPIIFLAFMSASGYAQMYHFNAMFEDKKNDKTYYVLRGGNFTHRGTEYACLCVYDEQRPYHCQSVTINADFHDFSNEIRYAFSNDGEYIALLKEIGVDGVLTPVRLDIYYLLRSRLVKSFKLEDQNIESVDDFRFKRDNHFTLKHDKGKIDYQIE